MKHTIIREQPVQPPVEKIVLEVTPAELVTLVAAVGKSSHVNFVNMVRDYSTTFTPQAPAPEDAFGVFKGLTKAGRDAGVTR